MQFSLQGGQSQFSGGPFAVINGALAEDVVCIYIPEAVELERPIHAIFATSGGTLVILHMHFCAHAWDMLNAAATIQIYAHTVYGLLIQATEHLKIEEYSLTRRSAYKSVQERLDCEY